MRICQCMSGHAWRLASLRCLCTCRILKVSVYGLRRVAKASLRVHLLYREHFLLVFDFVSRDVFVDRETWR